MYTAEAIEARERESVADADIFTNIYLKSILCGGWFTSVHITRTLSSSLSLFGFIRFVSKRRDSHSTLDGHTSHSLFGLYIFQQRVRAYTCYMSDKISCLPRRSGGKCFKRWSRASSSRIRLVEQTNEQKIYRNRQNDRPRVMAAAAST